MDAFRSIVPHRSQIKVLKNIEDFTHDHSARTGQRHTVKLIAPIGHLNWIINDQNISHCSLQIIHVHHTAVGLDDVHDLLCNGSFIKIFDSIFCDQI